MAEAKDENTVDAGSFNTVIGYRATEPIPFMIPAAKHEVAYRWAQLAVIVHSIECDGKSMAPTGQGIAINKFETDTLHIKDGLVTYFLDRDMLVSIQKFDQKPEEYFAVMYQLPRVFSKLEITYSIRFPDGISKPQRVILVPAL